MDECTSIYLFNRKRITTSYRRILEQETNSEYKVNIKMFFVKNYKVLTKDNIYDFYQISNRYVSHI